MSDPIPTDPDELERWTYERIGEFIYWFSRVEWALRLALSSQALDLPSSELSQLVLPQEFNKLCDVTLAVYGHKGTHTETELRQIRKLISRCREINRIRNRIAHGTWGRRPEDLSGHLATHMSRELRVTEHFRDPADLARAADDCKKLSAKLILFPGSFLTQVVRQAARAVAAEMILSERGPTRSCVGRTKAGRPLRA